MLVPTAAPAHSLRRPRGAAIFDLQDRLSNLSATYWQFWLSMLVLMVLLAHGGVMALLATLGDRVRGRNR